MPHLFAGRRGYTLSVEPRLDGLCAAPIGGEPEYPLHHLPLWLVDHERVTRLVVPKTVGWLHRRDDLALASFLEFSSPASLSELCPLVLRELVQHAIRQLALGAIVAPIVERADLRPMLLELTAEKVMIGRLAGNAIPILRQHHGNAPSGHEVPHTVHTWPLKAGAALSGIYYLLEDLVPLSGGVGSQSFDLLGEGVAGAGLLVCGDAGVEDGPEDSPLQAVAVR